MQEQEQEHDTLCWGCEKASGRCSWSKKFVPVEGWKAIPTTKSFDVYECPEFEPLKAMNTRRFLDEVNFVKIEAENQREANKRNRKEFREMLRKMIFEEGKSVPEIAKETGCSRMMLYRIKKKGERG